MKLLPWQCYASVPCVLKIKRADGYLFKGDSKQRCTLARKQRKYANASTCKLCKVVPSIVSKLCKVVLSIVRQQNEFFTLNLSSLRCSPVGLLFTNEEQQRVGL